MQALWKLALGPVAETLADPNSYGFRPERSTADAIEQCFITLAKRASPEWILEGDIRGCHPWLLKHVTMEKEVLQKWLQAGYIDEGTLFETSAGTPQGGIMSPVIANTALDGLEAAVYASVGSSKLSRSKAQLNVIRYADEFVVTGASKDVLECPSGGQAVPGHPRSGTLRGEDPDHEHRGGFRFPWPERTQVRRQTIDQAGKEEC
ncbi:reverse transcriptase domain-containing protein [Mesorhizobium sp. M0847]|uniref:reverse transcriptase domain-containing protein n=1 Tax=unclassified Mesorhizobium TaxID=325217 RepID=UPI0033364E28